MNARQKCKKLKSEIKRMKDGAPRIIKTYKPIQEYAATSPIAPELGDHAIEFAKRCVVRELIPIIEDYVEWENVDYMNNEMLMGRIMLIGERKTDCEQEV